MIGTEIAYYFNVMKIAISYWQNCISPVFDVAEKLLLVDINNGQIQRNTVVINSSSAFVRAREISDLGADVLICGAISRTMEVAFIGEKIEVMGFIFGPVEEILNAFINGTLADGPSPSSPPHRRRRRQRGFHQNRRW